MILESYEGIAIRLSRGMIFGDFNVGNGKFIEELVKKRFVGGFVKIADEKNRLSGVTHCKI